MGIQDSLAAIQARNAEVERKRKAAEEAREQGRLNWLTMHDGEVVKMWWLQEIDRGALGYSEKMGLAIFADEHSKPGEYQKKAVCSADTEGQCRGCELYKTTPYVPKTPTWKSKSTYYANVLVERTATEFSEKKKPDNEKVKIGTVYQDVYVASFSNGPKAVIPKMVLDYAVEANTLTDRWWKVTRNGTGSDTSYVAFVHQPSEDVKVEDYADKVADLHRCVREPSYAEQEAFYFGVAEKPSTPQPAQAGGVSQEAEW